MTQTTTLREVVRREVKWLDEQGSKAVPDVIKALKDAGATKDIHLNRTDLGVGTDLCVEWYAGQILDILESGSLYAVNSVINTLDKFCPEEVPEHATN